MKPIAARDGEPEPARHLYVPPAGDEPLDEIEQAFVRALVKIIAREIRREQPQQQADQAAAAPAGVGIAADTRAS